MYTPAQMAKRLKIVNLEEGLPTVEQARSRLKDEIARARQNGFGVLKVIHGYGSSGIGGSLRLSVQAMLRQMAGAHDLRGCIYGEDWRTSDEHTWALLKSLPELKSDRDLGKGNRGITIVVL